VILISRDTLGDTGRALEREWLEANGLGGFASSSVLGVNTRRYHGLLVAATHPPTGRMVMVSRVEDAIVRDGYRLELSSAIYPGAMTPDGHANLREFRYDTFPTFVYGDTSLTLKKTIFMPHGANTCVVLYELVEADEPIELHVRPFIAARDYHALTRANDSLTRSVARLETGGIKVAPYDGVPPVSMTLVSVGWPGGSAGFDESPDWYFRVQYPEEQSRGLDFEEDLFTYGVFRIAVKPGKTVAFVVTTEAELPAAPGDLLKRERQRRRDVARLAGPIPASQTVVRSLIGAADAFVVRRGAGATIIAGYHWFTDWTRDSMISLPGLLLATGRLQEAKDLLQGFAEHVRDGLLPNRFPDSGPPEYNAVDASLWFFVAAKKYLDYSADSNFVLIVLRPVLEGILAAYERGTSFGIHMDADGLIAAGADGYALTWMDARIGDWIVTPRRGKPVEVNALWYNAVRFAEDLAVLARDEKERRRLNALAERIVQSFDAAFWYGDGGYLYDVIRPDGRPDASIRPNQVFALSLPYPLIAGDRAESILDVVERELLTPIGLRTLSPRDPAYVNRYRGDQCARDGSYHQGTVWPWLLGPMITASVAVRGRTPATLARLRGWLASIEGHLAQAGVGFISEICEADPPHAPCGCIAQAWSVAEVLRACREDLAPAARTQARARVPNA
jgi:predicted glycogen debranching enzyme